MAKYEISKSCFWDKGEINEIDIPLPNGEKFTIIKNEIEDFSVELSDNLRKF